MGKELVFAGLGIADLDEGMGAAPKQAFNRAGLTKLQQRTKDTIWSSIFSRVAVPVTANARTSFFSGAPASLAAGNVNSGQLPAPQSMAVHEVTVNCAGIAGAGITPADAAKLAEAVLEITVASKLMLQTPLSRAGVNGVVLATTSGGGGIPNGPVRSLELRIPIIIPSSTQFEVTLTSGEDAYSGILDTQITLSGEITRLVV